MTPGLIAEHAHRLEDRANLTAKIMRFIGLYPHAWAEPSRFIGDAAAFVGQPISADALAEAFGEVLLSIQEEQAT